MKKTLIVVLSLVMTLCLGLAACAQDVKGKISGTVTVNSEPMAGVTVTVGETTATTSEDGKYTIETKVEAGTVVTFALEGYITVAKTINATDIVEGNATVDAELEQSATISGTVKSGATQAALEGVTVIIEVEGEAVEGKQAVTAADGTYAISEIPISKYTVRMTKDGFNPFTKNISTINFRDGNATVNATLVQIGTVTGKVTDKAGAPLAEVTVKFLSKTTKTAADGTYTIADISIGSGTVSFEKKGYVSQTVSLTAASFVSAKATANAVMEGEVLPGLSKEALELLTSAPEKEFVHGATIPIKGKWGMIGDLQDHSQGYCPHGTVSGTDMSSYIYAKFAINESNCSMTIAARHFTEQGDAGQMGIKVVDASDYSVKMVRANNAAEDWVTVNEDNYMKFTYDLSAYKGKTVIIAIGNRIKGHCCINRIKFTTTAAQEVLPYVTTDDIKTLSSLNANGEAVKYAGDSVYNTFFRVGGVGKISEGTHFDADRKPQSGTNPATDNVDMDNYIYGRFTISELSKFLKINTRCFVSQAEAGAGLPYLIVKVVPLNSDGTINAAKQTVTFDPRVVDSDDMALETYDLTEYIGGDIALFIGTKYGHKLVVNPIELTNLSTVTGIIKNSDGVLQGVTVSYGTVTVVTDIAGKYTIEAVLDTTTSLTATIEGHDGGTFIFEAIAIVTKHDFILTKTVS